MSSPAGPLDGESELLVAAETGDSQLVRRFIAAGTAVNVRRPSDGSTPLLLAALGAHTDTVRLLLDHDADVSLAKVNGATPVFAAAAADAGQCIRLLCAAGSKPDAANLHGVTPVQMAAHKNNVASLRVLVSLGATASMADQAGNAALHKAAREGALESIEALVAHARDCGGTAAVRALLLQSNHAGKTAVEVGLDAGMSGAVLRLIHAERAAGDALFERGARLESDLKDVANAREVLEAQLLAQQQLHQKANAEAGQTMSAQAANANADHAIFSSSLAALELEASMLVTQVADSRNDAAQLSEELMAMRNELGCANASLAVAREAHASAANALRSSREESDEMRAELLAAREELGGGTLAECKLQLKEFAVRMAAMEDDASTSEASREAVEAIMAEELARTEHSLAALEDSLDPWMERVAELEHERTAWQEEAQSAEEMAGQCTAQMAGHADECARREEDAENDRDEWRQRAVHAEAEASRVSRHASLLEEQLQLLHSRTELLRIEVQPKAMAAAARSTATPTISVSSPGAEECGDAQEAVEHRGFDVTDMDQHSPSTPQASNPGGKLLGAIHDDDEPDWLVEAASTVGESHTAQEPSPSSLTHALEPTYTTFEPSCKGFGQPECALQTIAQSAGQGYESMQVRRSMSDASNESAYSLHSFHALYGSSITSPSPGQAALSVALESPDPTVSAAATAAALQQRGDRSHTSAAHAQATRATSEGTRFVTDPQVVLATAATAADKVAKTLMPVGRSLVEKAERAYATSMPVGKSLVEKAYSTGQSVAHHLASDGGPLAGRQLYEEWAANHHAPTPGQSGSHVMHAIDQRASELQAEMQRLRSSNPTRHAALATPPSRSTAPLIDQEQLGGTFWEPQDSAESAAAHHQRFLPSTNGEPRINAHHAGAELECEPAGAPQRGPQDDDQYEDVYRAAMKAYRSEAFEEAERCFRQALALKQSFAPRDDPQLAVVYNNLGATLEKRGMPRDAEALYKEAISICETRLPPEHPRLQHIRTKLVELQATLFPFPGLARAEQRDRADDPGEDFVSQ